MVYAQPRNCPRKWDAQNSMGFWDTNGLSNLGQATWLIDCQQQQQQQQNKKYCRMVDFAVPADDSVKLKESKTRDKYRDLTRDLKKNYGTWKLRWYQL